MTTYEYLQTPETVLPRELVFGALRVADAPRAPISVSFLNFCSRWRRSSAVVSLERSCRRRLT